MKEIENIIPAHVLSFEEVGQCKVRESFIGSNDLEWNDLIEIQ